MSLELAAIPLASTIVSTSFAVVVLRQLWARRGYHHLFWSVGLLLFAGASLCEAVAEGAGWSVPLYKAYYAMSATLVAFLGLGTVYLLGDKRLGHAFLVYVLVVAAAFLVVLAAALVEESAFDRGLFIGGEGLGPGVRVFSPAFTVPGSIALIGGALYSWWRVRANYNLLIAGGALIMAAGGAASRIGHPASGPQNLGLLLLQPLSILVGIVVMYAGFIKSAELPLPSERPDTRAAPAPRERD